MQETAMAIEREARYRLPHLLADLLEEPDVPVEAAPQEDDLGVDLIASDSRGRQWVMEVKSSSRPGQVSRAAEQLLPLARADVIPLLIVPFMSRAGAEAADRARSCRESSRIGSGAP
jgi:hypothetical protein